MAGDWIKMRSNIGTDPDVVALAATLGTDEFSVVGRLHALWAWADQHSEDGSLPRATSAFVDRLTACPGFAEALRGVGWLEGRESALRLPDWDRHNGSTAKGRAETAIRMAKMRRKSVTNVTETPQHPCAKNVTREEESREEKTNTPRPETPHEATPSEADVLAHGKTLHPPAEEGFCRWWWNKLESKGWTEDGTPVRRWKNAFNAAASAAKHNDHERNKRYPSKPSAHERTAADRERDRTGIAPAPIITRLL